MNNLRYKNIQLNINMRILFELGKGDSLKFSYCSLNAESQALGTFTALLIIWTTLSSNLANFRECLTRQ